MQIVELANIFPCENHGLFNKSFDLTKQICIYAKIIIP